MREPRRRVIGLLGLPMDRVTLQEATDKVRHAARHQQRLFLSTPNLNFLMGCQTDLDFRLSVIDSDLSTADGMPLIWMSRWLGAPLPERVTGSNIFERLLSDPLRPGQAPLKVYFFGGPDGAAQQAADKLNRMPQSLVCVGHASPGFGSVEALSAPHWIEDINASQADILIIAMGALKGQTWLQKNRTNLHVPVISHLGAVINFAAGSVLRAPLWVQRTGLEWLWRIKEEPNLWRRYGQDALSFARVFGTQLLPGIAWSRMNTWRSKVSTAQLEWVADSVGPSVLRLSGAWRDADIALAHADIDRLKNQQKTVLLDITGLSDMGPALAGELLELYRCLRQQGRSMSVVADSGRSQRLLHWHGLTFMKAGKGKEA
jgi:N-acetylglucosaminyldiphosphoundecaprenol N-acetyl-beta-D-mannosaminyltransferase